MFLVAIVLLFFMSTFELLLSDFLLLIWVGTVGSRRLDLVELIGSEIERDGFGGSRRLDLVERIGSEIGKGCEKICRELKMQPKRVR